MAETRSLPYVRSIDGLRGVAVLLVLGFHAEVPGASGGFLGVSLFFTLSGYLITQLLLREHESQGRISLRGFWGRRLRRLAPASLAALSAIGVLVALTDVFPGAAVPGDLAAAVTDVANWRFAVSEASYADLFTAGPSPVLHFWSLAIEEQFYVVFPLLVALVLRRLGRTWLPAVLAGLVAAGTVASVAASPDLSYYGTHTRAPELLVGALLGLALPIGRPLARRAQRAVAGAGLLGAAALAVLVAATRVDSGWLYAGGLPAVSLASAAVIAASTVPGPVSRATAWSPAVAIGRVSYGVYVYHWPIFLLLTADRLGLGGPGLVAVRLAATGAVAVASALLLEDPVRRRAVLHRARAGAGAFAGAMAVVLALAVVATPPAAPDVLPSERDVVAFGGEPDPPIDVVVLGSVPEVEAWVRAGVPDGLDVRVRASTQAGCPTLLPDRAEGACRSFADRAGPASTPTPDLVVVGMGPNERAPMADALRRIEQGDDLMEATAEALSLSRQVVDMQMAALPSVPVLFVDTTPDGPLTSQVRELSLVSDDVSLSLATDGPALRRDLVAVLDELRQDTRLRVLVIGDSTSLNMATALDAAGHDRVRVVWAGLSGCALVPTTQTRWGPELDLDTSDCPSTQRRWPEAIAALHPDVVLAAASLGALAEHRYAGSDDWVVPGAPRYGAAHDAGMAALQELLADEGALTLVATTPPLLRGKLYDGPIGDPARLEAWMAQVARWDEAWASVGIVDWAAIVAQVEAAAGGDELRVDAVHFGADTLMTRLGPPLLERLLTAHAALEASARDAGCLVGAADERRLDLARCRGADGGPGAGAGDP